MIAVVAADRAEALTALLRAEGETVYQLGRIVPGEGVIYTGHPDMKRVAILISGGGSNMVALVRAMTGDYPARPVLVFSNDPGAAGLAKAAALGVPTAAVDHRPFGKDRAGFEAELAPRPGRGAARHHLPCRVHAHPDARTSCGAIRAGC